MSEQPSRSSRLLSSRFGPVFVMVAIMWAVYLLDAVTPGRLTWLGVTSWDWSRIWGIVTMPFVHGSWFHLLSNTLPFIILGCLVALGGSARFLGVTAIVGLVSGIGVFAVNSPGTLTVGASGLVFGYFGYLLVDGFVEPNARTKIWKISLAVIIAAIWGIPMLLGALPIRLGVSWQGHLFGLIGGVAAGLLYDRGEIRNT